MPSLLDRAIRISARLHPKRAPAQVGSDDGISPEERSALAAEIDRLFTDRSLISESAPRRAHRSGIALPIAINLIAVALLAGGILLTHAFGAGGPRTGSHEAGSFTTAEGLIVQQVREQASKQLSAREQRIAAVERELAQLQTAKGGASASQAGVSEARRLQLERELASLKDSERSHLANATTQLADLAAAREHERFLVRQLQAVYQTIQANLSAGHLNEALAGVAAADRVLSLAEGEENGQMAPLLPAFQAGDTVLRIAILSNQELARVSGSAAVTATRLKELEGTVASLGTTLKDRDQNIERDRIRLAAQAATIERQSRLIAEQRDAIRQRDAELAVVIASLQRGIRRLRAEVASSGSASLASEGRAGSAQGGVVDLLSTKVTLREAISSKEVRSAYPGLYSNLDRFFQRYGEVYAQQGRLSAFKQIDTALNDVVSTMATEVGLSTPPTAGALADPGSPKGSALASSTDPVSSYLAQLDAILSGMLRESTSP